MHTIQRSKGLHAIVEFVDLILNVRRRLFTNSSVWILFLWEKDH